MSGGIALPSFRLLWNTLWVPTSIRKLTEQLGQVVTKHLNSIKAASGLHGIAHLIGFKPKNLAYILYGIPDANKYTEFTIPKKNGGVRRISCPIPKLKHVQARLAHQLSLCLAEIEVSENVKENCVLSHGFKRGLSIASNAANHTGRRWVLNVDLKDFFPSIHFGRVRGYFIKNKYFELDTASATIIAQIACYNNMLPQGAPSSPVISNLIGSNLDISLNRLARKNRCTYTRYADDLTFSTNRREFSKDIASPIQDLTGDWIVGDELRYRISRSGFDVNPTKTRMQLFWSRQDATGLVVNAKVNVPRDYVKYVRARCDHFAKGNAPFKLSSVNGSKLKLPVGEEQLQGMLAHILRIKGPELEFKRPKVWKDAPAYLITHQKFLDYKCFAAQHLPSILCEGKTDTVYIRCALRAFDKHYPSMIADDGSKELRVKLLRYSRTTDFVQGLGGGTGDLKEFIYSYNSRLKKFAAQPPNLPTIMVVDNDQGSKGKNGVFSAVKNVSGGPTVDGTKTLYHVTRNLYLVPTPLLPKAKDSMIEDFLKDSVRKTVLNGKSLNLDEKSFDKTKHYGKAIFAKYVVRRHADAIDFSGYQSLLEALDQVIVDYSKRISP